MAALVIVNINITDPVGYEEYKRIAAPTVVAPGEDTWSEGAGLRR